MELTRSISTRNRSPNLSLSRPILESETRRVQRSVERESYKYEFNKGKGLILDENISEMQKSLSKAKEQLPNTFTTPKLQFDIETLERQVKLYETKVGLVQSENHNLRLQIDHLRIERMSRHKTLSLISDDVAQAARSASSMNRESVQNSHMKHSYTTKIKGISETNSHENSIYSGKLSQFDSTIKSLDIKRKQTFEQQKNELQKARNSSDFIAGIDVTKLLLQTWGKKLFVANKLIKEYYIKAEQLETILNRMKQSEGIDSNEQIIQLCADFFHAFEKQHHSLNYIESLIISEQKLYTKLSQFIKQFNGEVYTKLIIAKTVLSGYQKSLSTVQRKRNRICNKTKIFEQGFQNSENAVQRIYNLTRNLPANAQYTNYNEPDTFQYRNIYQRLKYIEEFVHRLIIASIRLKQEDDPVLRFMNLDDIEVKVDSKIQVKDVNSLVEMNVMNDSNDDGRSPRDVQSMIKRAYDLLYNLPSRSGRNSRRPLPNIGNSNKSK